MLQNMAIAYQRGFDGLSCGVYGVGLLAKKYKEGAEDRKNNRHHRYIKNEHICQEDFKECSSKDQMCVFIVRDFTTELVGRFNEEGNFYYVQRGDGKIKAYDADRVTFAQNLISAG